MAEVEVARVEHPEVHQAVVEAGLPFGGLHEHAGRRQLAETAAVIEVEVAQHGDRHVVGGDPDRLELSRQGPLRALLDGEEGGGGPHPRRVVLQLRVHARVEDDRSLRVLDEEGADGQAHGARGAGEHPAGIGGEPAALERPHDEAAALLELAHHAQPPA